MDDCSVVVKDLWHGFGRRPAVLRGVDLVAQKGGITALLGLNGAGKTTLIRSLMGLVRPQAAAIEVLGHRLGIQPPPPQLLARIGYVPERPLPAERMTARELLALLHEVHPRWQEGTVRRYLQIFHIPLDVRCKALSAGTKAQLALTLAMAGQPELLILDEPTLGLDPLHRHQYLQLLLEEVTGREMTILLTTHDLYQIERLADNIAILHGGRIVVQESIDDLKEHTKRIRIGATDPSADLAGILAGLPGITMVQPDPGGFLAATTAAPHAMVDRIRSLPGVHGVQMLDLSLEEIFLVYCGEAAPNALPGSLAPQISPS